MELPASYYGDLDKRNPVIVGFKRDINSFMALMRQITSNNQDRGSYAKGIKILVEIWRKYKHRLPVKLFQDHMLQIADFLFGLKLFQLAQWHGYSLHLLQFTSVKIMDITDVGHFMASFFPEGFDADQDTFAMKIRAMYGCALCIFEEEKNHSILSQEGLNKLLCVLNFIRIMMQALQQNELFYHQLYDGSVHIYSICRYLMTMKCSAQALEYLLWASISLEMSIPLMTTKYLPLMVTLYCAVCHCYYDNQAAVHAEEFARRALGKINELAKLDEQSKVSATRETQRAYKEASIKLGAMIFKRAVFEGRKRPKFSFKPKTTLKDLSNGPWPHTQTERMLSDLFDSRAGQFLAILEALQNSNARPLQIKMPDDLELQEVIVELQSAGIAILSGRAGTREQRCDNHRCLSPIGLTPTSDLIDQAIKGENDVTILSAVRFIKLLFQYKPSESFITELVREMLLILSGVEGHSFRKAERELALLDCFNTVLTSQRRPPREDSKTSDRRKSSLSLGNELTGLVHTLHKSACDSAPDEQADGDLVLDIVVYTWSKVKEMIQRNQLCTPGFTHHLQTIGSYDELVLCLSMLCKVAFACNLAIVDCVMTFEMTSALRILFDSAPERFTEAQQSEGCVQNSDNAKCSTVELLQRVREAAESGQETVRWDMLQPPEDCSAITDFAYMQKWNLLSPSTTSTSSSSLSEKKNQTNEISLKEKEKLETKIESDFKDSQQSHSTCMYLLAKDLHLELDLIHHKASLLLLQLNAVSEIELLDRIKNNKVSKALFLIQKASLVYKDRFDNSKTTHLLQEASTLIEKACIEERKVYMSTCHTPSESQSEKKTEGAENPPPPPNLLSRTDHSLTFLPAPYNLEEQVCWYRLSGRVADGIKKKVLLGDCNLPGTGNMVPAVSGECVLKVEGLEPNRKYVFAVAAYNSEGKLLGNTIGGTTLPVLASIPVSLLSSWAHLAQVAFQTEQYAIAKKACRELWMHYTDTVSEARSPQDRFATTGLHKQTLHCSSPHLCQLFLSSIFIETEINIKEGSLYCNSFSENGPVIWEQEARLVECERMLVAMDLAMCLNDGGAAIQAAVGCYGLLTPLIFHQIIYQPVVQVLKKCLVVLEENSGHLKQKWIGNTTESIMQMIACITYYLSKALRILEEPEVAAAVMDCGRKLLQEVYAQRVSKGVFKGVQLMALHMMDKMRITPEANSTTENEISRPLTGCEDLSLLYELISISTLNDAYQDVMTLRCASCFAELSALLLQRALEEGRQDLVLDWGTTVIQILSGSKKLVEGSNHTKRRNDVQASKGNDAPQRKKDPSSTDDLRKRLKEMMPHSMIKKVKTNREVQLVEKLLNTMSFAVQHNKKQLQRRKLCHEQSVWRSHLNSIMAQAHLELLYQGLEKLPGGALQHRYSQLNPSYFSLAYSGIVMQRNSQRCQSSNYANVFERHSSLSGTLNDEMRIHKNKKNNKKGGAIKKDVHRDDSVKEESSDSEDGFSKAVEQQVETQEQRVAFLDSLNKVALHLRRAMVLAHRGSHWTTLQFVCQTMWDQKSAINVLVQRTSQLESPPLITADELHSVFTPLLVLATDLIMDMLNKLGLWSVYDRELTEEELETDLHFSAPLDDCIQVDLRWVRTLVLHTLEQLHDSGKWETLAHFALLFNSYTRERYAVMVIPLLVDAQRWLLERISSFEGPAVPQPHHVKTHEVTGIKVTCRSYADCQLLSGWKAHSAQKQANCKKVSFRNITPRQAAEFKDAEIRLSMILVRVPLDVEDTLRCNNEALDKKPHCLQVFQYARSLLALLLAHTQPCFVTQFQHCESRGLSRSESRVDFSPVVKHSPTKSCDLTEEDFSPQNAISTLPISPDHMPTVVAAYSEAIKYLHANKHECLRVQALHEMGNLHFYNGNTRAAHSSWSKAVDCALQCSGVVDKWDGVSYGSGSMQQTLKQAGILGCLQAAVLTAKIAQYILTFDVSQRTTCCLLSAHLFKCVLSCSMAQPQTDLQYASHSIVNELFPGTDLFSEHQRNHISTPVTSLSFICHWLFTNGYYITVLPVIVLHQYFVENVCRDVHRTVDCKILKIRVLTQLCLFTEAVKEMCQLTQGVSVLKYYGHHFAQASLKPMKMFHCDKPLSDNVEALGELVNCDFDSEVLTLYGPTLCIRLNLARAQLVLALANSECGSAVPASAEDKTSASPQFGLATSQQQERDTEDIETSSQNTEEQNIVTAAAEKQKHSLESIKCFLLEGVSSLLHSISQQLTSHFCSEMENLELTIELNLLKGQLLLQRGHPVLSTEVAVSSLELLQTSRLVDERSIPGLKHDNTDCSVSENIQVDCPRAVEASERVGASLWLRSRLALFHSLTASSAGSTALLPDKNHNDEAALVLHEGIEECALWRDLDTHALLMVEGAELEAKRGRSEGSMTMLQKAVSMLSGRTHMPPGSIMTLARATLLLSDLRGVQSTTLLQLTQKLLKNQLFVFGQTVTLVDGKMCVSTPGPNNIYLPYLHMLNQITLRIGHTIAHGTKESQVTEPSSPSTSKQSSHHPR